MSVYGFGQQWTGALSRGPSDILSEEAPEASAEEMRQFGERQNMVPLRGADGVCVGASAGWGHTALLVADEIDGGDERAAPRLMVCGRPHEFQTLLRLRRLPGFLRNFCITNTLPSEEERGTSDEPRQPPLLQRIATYFAGEEERAIFHEDECRRFGNVPELLEIELPDGEVPAVKGDRIDELAYNFHAGKSAAREDNSDVPQRQKQQSSPPLHSQFQTTLAASAGVTAVISETSTLYAFGLNHRGQCGSGSFAPNVWTPGRVAGLASTRFILDHGSVAGEDMFKEFREQENPIVSVALGLQHGVALDSEGQVFCWGKGERGQLGQGRRMAYEGYRGDGDDGIDGGRAEEGTEENESRTFEHALHVANFYDPFATIFSREGYAPLLSHTDSRVRLISAGMNFTMAVTESNLPYVWGKNVCLNPHHSESGINIRSKPVLDSTYPRYVPGLPPDLRIEKVACGTHHAAMLLEDGSIWAVGVATDRPVPLWDEAVEILAPGAVDARGVASFTAGFDRTVVVAPEQMEEGIR